MVCDDEERLTRTSVALLSEGYAVELARDEPSGMAQAQAGRLDLVIIDLASPGPSPLELCRWLRAGWPDLILVVVAHAGSPEEMVVASFQAGADGYLTRPGGTRELIARIRALLRRRPEVAEDVGETLVVGDVTLDRARHQVWVAGQEIAVPLKEFSLLEIFMANPGVVLTHRQLLDHVWGHVRAIQDKTLEVHISNLRARIEENPSRPTSIVTVRGIGYRFQKPRT